MSDVVGSSAKWEADHDRMDQAVRLLDTLVHDAVDGRDGIVVKLRGEGDSHFSVFRRASDAIAAAVDIQRYVSTVAWPEGFALGVRAAVHSAESDSRDGDYYGMASIARPVCAAPLTPGRSWPRVKPRICRRRVSPPTSCSAASGRIDCATGRGREFFQALAPDLPSSFPPLDTLPESPRVMAVVVLHIADWCRPVEQITDDDPCRRHRRIARLWRTPFDDLGGRFLQTLGDRCLAVFDDPRAGVRYAETVIADGDREGFVVHGAVDAGTLLFQDADVLGRAVFGAHRLVRSAAAEQLVVSPTVANLVSQADLNVSSSRPTPDA